MADSISGTEQTLSRNGNSLVTNEAIKEYASKTANPALWLYKYNYYISSLKLSDTEAKEWADADVSINTEARKEFGLPPAQPQHNAAA